MPPKISLPKIAFWLLHQNILISSFKNVQFAICRVISVLPISPHTMPVLQSHCSKPELIFYLPLLKNKNYPYTLAQGFNFLPKRSKVFMQLRSIPLPQPLDPLYVTERHHFPMHILGLCSSY